MADEIFNLVGDTVRVDKCLHDLVLDASIHHPDRIAVVFDNCTDGFHVVKYTYTELMCMSSWIKRILGHWQCCHEVIGVLCLDQPTLPAWLIGILSTPAAFLPLASDISDARIRKLIKSLHLKLILTDSSKKKMMDHLIPDLIDVTYSIRDLMTVDIIGSSVNINLPDYLDLYFVLLRAEGSKWAGSNHKQPLAYVITTSGTTGLPKIVSVPHQCIMSNIIHISEIYKLSPSDCVYQASALTFDPSIVEIFTTLKSGATLILFPEDVRTRPQDLVHYLSVHHVTIIQATPTLISSIGAELLSRTLLSNDSSLKVLALGGEKCPSHAIINSWRAENNSTCIINLYGITEVSSWAMYHVLSEQDAKRPGVPLGQPLFNTVVSIKTWNKEHDKENDVGQIYIGGSTRLCFVDDDDDNDDDVTMRASGDLVRLEEGCLYYVGRTDEQIKYKGKRINLSEIENVCEQHPSVQKASVLFNHPKLHLFVVLRQEHSHISDVLAFLKQRLPTYSIPTDTTTVVSMPITKHGKIDKKELLRNYHKEQIQAKLSTLWKHHTQQSLDSDVQAEVRFTECGGDSVSATRLVDIIETKIIGYSLADNRLLVVLLTGDFGSLVNIVCNELYNDTETTITNQNRPSSQSLGLRNDLSKSEEEYSSNIRSDSTPANSTANDLQSSVDVPADDYKPRSDSDDSINTMQQRKKLKTSDLNVYTSNRTSDCFTHSTDVLSISRMSQIQIHNQNHLRRIDPERLCDICCPRLNLREEWRFNMGKCVDSSPLVVVTRSGNATVYIGSHSKQCTLAAISVNDGKEVWSVPLFTRIEASPVLSKCGQFVVVGAYDHNIYVYEASTGFQHWKYTTGDQVKDSACVNPVSGLIYVGSHDHNVYCIDIQVKHCLWKAKVDGCVFASPCIVMEPYHLFIATTKGNVYCLNPDTGDTIWYLSLESPVFSSPALTPSGICVGTVSHVICLLTYNGEKLWSYQCDGPIFSSPCVYATQQLDWSTSLSPQDDFTQLNQTSELRHEFSFCCVFGCHSSEVFCLSGKGKLLWQHRMPSQVYSSPFIISNDVFCKKPVVVICCTTGLVHVLDLKTGHLIGYKQIEGQIFSSPVVWNDKLIFGCRDNNVYCLKISLGFMNFLN